MRRQFSISLLALGVCLSLLIVPSSGFLETLKSWFFGSPPTAQKSEKAKKKRKSDNNRPRPKPAHAEGVEVADFSDTKLPLVRVGKRVIDLMNGAHFDSILQDTPDEIRPPSVIAFYDSNDEQCMQRFKAIDWDFVAEKNLPARERVMVARYDTYSAPKRAWYKFTPEMDLQKRFKVDACPQVVFAPRSCNGWTEWCVRGKDPEDPNISLIGCDNFVEVCNNTVKWNGSGKVEDWILKMIESEEAPKISRFLRTYKEQGVWLQKREVTTTNTYLRNIYLSQAFPAFTKTGFKAVETPKPVQDWLMGFFQRQEQKRRLEFWQGESTQMSFHETPTTFIDLDMEGRARDEIANTYIKPIVEEWSGMKDLELTAFYGIREYPDGSWLRNHVDRIDTHVLSVTISLFKAEPEKSAANPWPLEVVRWSGDHVRYEHPGGTMVLYESSKLPHGRPYRNNGGTHVGCFVHFKPKSMHTSEAAKWDRIARQARQHQGLWSQFGRFMSQATVEPEHPVYAELNVGANTQWTHLSKAADGSDDDDEEEAKQQSTSKNFGVTFKNQAERPLEVFWLSHAGEKVSQGKIGPSASFGVNTFEGHVFFFAEVGSEEPLPGGKFTMERGQTVYKYALTKEGKPKNPSKWANHVRERLKQEQQLEDS